MSFNLSFDAQIALREMSDRLSCPMSFVIEALVLGGATGEVDSAVKDLWNSLATKREAVGAAIEREKAERKSAAKKERSEKRAAFEKAMTERKAAMIREAGLRKKTKPSIKRHMSEVDDPLDLPKQQLPWSEEKKIDAAPWDKDTLK